MLRLDSGGNASNSILIVSSDEGEARYLERALRQQHYKVETVHDSVDAGLLIMGGVPALLIVDTHLPDMSGFDFVEVLRSDVMTPHVPVVFISVDGDGERRSLELRAEGLLRKPVALERLLPIIRTTVGRNAAACR